MNSCLNDNLTGARVVKAFGQQDSEIERFEKSNQRVRNAELSLLALTTSLLRSMSHLKDWHHWLLGDSVHILC